MATVIRLTPKSRSNMFRSIALLLVAVCSGCAPDFGGDYEYTNLTLDGYRDLNLAPTLALTDVSEIYYRQFGTRDSVEEWWRFRTHPDALDGIVAACRNSSHAEWRDGIGDPSCRMSDDKPPSWWEPTDGPSTITRRWCYPAGSAERHHGWYITFDPSTSVAHVWRWNHQWSSCDSASGG